MKNKTRIPNAILSVFLSCILIFSPITSVITYAITGPTISVESVKIQPGKSVEVDISLNNNPGIASMVCPTDARSRSGSKSKREDKSC